MVALVDGLLFRKAGCSNFVLWLCTSSDICSLSSSSKTKGGDFTNANGTGGESIYGKKFDDEWGEPPKFLPHSEAGMLSMANSGKNTNGSQFFLTTEKATHLNCKHVVFGKIIDGMDVLRAIEETGSKSGATSQRVVISDCGELTKKSKTN